MSQAHNSDKTSQLIAGYILGTLDAAEAALLAQLVSEDPTIQAEIDQTQQALEAAYGITEVEPPPALQARITEAFIEKTATEIAPIAAEHPAESSGSHQKLRAPFSPSLTSAISPPISPSIKWLRASIGALILALGLSNYLWWYSRQQQAVVIRNIPNNSSIVKQKTPTQDPLTNTVSYTLRSTNPNDLSSADIVINLTTLAAQLNTAQLPALKANQNYALWVIAKPDAPYTTDSKSAILTDVFQVDPDGFTQETFVVPSIFLQPNFIAALGITVESIDAPQAHRGAPVLLVEL